MGDGPIVAGANADINPMLAVRSQQLRHAINTLNDNSQLVLIRCRAAEEFRAIISTYDPPEEFKEEIKDTFVNILKKYREDPFIIEQLLWALNNLSYANSSLIHEMVAKGIVHITAFIYRITDNRNLKDQTVMCLGNFAGDSFNLRSHVAQTNIHKYMMDDLDKQWTNLNTRQRNMYAWCLRNVFRPNYPSQEYAVTVQDKNLMLKVIEKLVLAPEAAKDETVMSGLGILKEWMSFDASKEANVLVARNEQLMNFCVTMLAASVVAEGDGEEIASIIVRIAGNIAFNDDDVIKHLLDYGFLNAMEDKLRKSRSAIVEVDIYWCLSNILGSHYPEYIKAIVAREELWSLMKNACYDFEPKIRREAIHCIINVLTFFAPKPAYDEMSREFVSELDRLKSLCNDIITFINTTKRPAA